MNKDRVSLNLDFYLFLSNSHNVMTILADHRFEPTFAVMWGAPAEHQRFTPVRVLQADHHPCRR